MEKKLKIILAVIVVAVIIVGTLFLVLKYVPMGERAKFVGTWRYENEPVYRMCYTFYSDGTCSAFGLPGTWEIENGKLYIYTWDGSGITSINEYSFSDDGETLTLGSSSVFTKIPVNPSYHGQK